MYFCNAGKIHNMRIMLAKNNLHVSVMPIKVRSKWYILDDQYFTFENLGRVSSITDVMNYNMVQH